MHHAPCDTQELGTEYKRRRCLVHEENNILGLKYTCLHKVDSIMHI